jgi:hypothetical protein
MFANTLRATIAVAPANHFDHLSRLIWKGHAAGAFDDATAQELTEELHARRRLSNERVLVRRYPGGFRSFQRPRGSDCRSPDRQRSLERRRRNALSGPMPPGLAWRFTVGQLAVMRIIADECRLRGRCDRTVGEIAARAGVCVRLAQMALRWAQTLSYISIEDRRLSAFRNDTNVVKVTSSEWQAWIAHGPREGGCKDFHRTDNQGFQANKDRVQAGAGSTLSSKMAGSSISGRGEKTAVRPFVGLT